MDEKKLNAWLAILEKITENIIPDFAVRIADFAFQIIHINIESLQTDDEKKLFLPKFIVLLKKVQPIIEGHYTSSQYNSLFFKELYKDTWNKIIERISEISDSNTQKYCQNFVSFIISEIYETSEKVPVLFCIFNKLQTTPKVFEAIKKSKPKKLYVSSDGWRKTKKGEKEKVEFLRKFVLENINWDCEIKTRFGDKNLGCKLGMETAIDWFFENEEMGIILEDDCLPSQSFFGFCSELLIKYKDDDRVFLICGFDENSKNLSANSYHFSEYPRIWGWATWRRAWNRHDKSISEIENYSKKYNWEFIENSAMENYCKNLYMKFLVMQLEAIVYRNFDTWDFQWFFSVMLNNAFCIIPDCNMITNIGTYVDDAAHCSNPLDSAGNIPTGNFYFPIKHKENVAANPMSIGEFVNFCYQYLGSYDNITGFKVKEKNSGTNILNIIYALNNCKSVSDDEKKFVQESFIDGFLNDMMYQAIYHKVYPKAQKYLYLALCKKMFPDKNNFCSNCKICITICPTKSVSLTQNNREFFIGINKDTCNLCFNCVKSCPIVNPK